MQEGTSDLEPGKQAQSGQVSQQQTWKRPSVPWMPGWDRFVFLGGLSCLKSSMFSSPWRAVIHRDPLCPDPQVVHQEILPWISAQEKEWLKKALFLSISVMDLQGNAMKELLSTGIVIAGENFFMCE